MFLGEVVKKMFSGSGSGSRRAKMTHKNIKKFRKVLGVLF
jgi:hypothetical protein